MDYASIINSRYSEPAAILSYKNGLARLLDVNDRFVSEHWTNTSKDEFIRLNTPKSFDDDNLRIFVNAVKKCIETGEDQEVETWRHMFSDCFTISAGSSEKGTSVTYPTAILT